MLNIPLQLWVDGVQMSPDAVNQRLVRAVLISLFTWRRADPGDILPARQKFGWWGDSFPTVPADRIGSKLWLLSRAKLTDETVAKAREYAADALQWMLDDNVATKIDVIPERQGPAMLALQTVITRNESTTTVRFNNIWDFLR